MSSRLSSLLSLLVVATLLLVLGVVIRRQGPQGFVHGMGDWSRLDAKIRQLVGKVMGNVMFAMAALIVSFASFSYLHADDPQRIGMAGLLLTIGISGLTIGLLMYLRRVQNSGGKDRHGR